MKENMNAKETNANSSNKTNETNATKKGTEKKRVNKFCVKRPHKKFYKILKNVIVLILVIFLVAENSYFLFQKVFPKKYTATATVIEIIPNDSENSTICFQLVNNKHIFCIETSEKYSIDEHYILTFSTKNTDTILDDEIVRIERIL